MIRWIYIIYIGVASSFCFGDLIVVREAVIAPKDVNAAANIGSVNSSVNVRMDLAKVDIHVAKLGGGALAPLPLNVRATFELVNESSDELKLTVGFPISNSEYSSFELSHFSVVTDGAVREVFRRIGSYPRSMGHEYVSGEKGPEKATPPTEIGSDNLFGVQSIGKDAFQNLMVWEETFAPTQRKKIEVDYEIEIPLQENKVVREQVESSSKGIMHGSANNVPIQFLQKVGTGSYYFFDYYLTSGASWAGSIGFEEITLYFDHWWRDLEFYSTIKQGEIGWSNRTLYPSLPIVATYQLRDEEPTENIYFAIRPGKNNTLMSLPADNKSKIPNKLYMEKN